MAERAALPVDDAGAALLQVAMRATPARLAIWRALREAGDEPDAVELMRRARALEPRTSLGTVYRFLRELEQHGLASSRPVPHERSRWRLGRDGAATSAPRDPANFAAIAQLAAAFGYRLVPMREA